MGSLFTGPNVITFIVLVGFSIVTFLAMKPETAGVNKDVVLYLLGAWQSMASAAVAYHIGSSAGSRDKDATIKSMSTDAATIATTTAATAATVAASAASVSAVEAAKAVAPAAAAAAAPAAAAAAAPPAAEIAAPPAVDAELDRRGITEPEKPKTS